MTARRIEVAVEPAWIDYNGHVTDAAYAFIAARAHEQVLDDLGLGEQARRRGDPVAFTARQLIEHRGEIPPGATVQVEPAVTRLGRTSLTLGSRLLVDDDLRADVECVYVQVDATGTPLPLTDTVRERARHWQRHWQPSS